MLHKIQKIALLILLLFAITYRSDKVKLASEHITIPNYQFKREPFVHMPSFERYFRECNVKGEILIYSCQRSKYYTNDTVGILKGTIPASTFKIFNLLVALETNVIEKISDTVYWEKNVDKKRYGGDKRKIWVDMTVERAFKISAGWVFVDLAQTIGKDNYSYYIDKVNYGNIQADEKEIDFWNFGNYQVTPVDQVRFLRNLKDENLPFDISNQKIVKELLLVERTPDYSIRGKTGWAGRTKGIDLGWWTGYFESKSDTLIFATRIIQDTAITSSNFSRCRKSITDSIISKLME